MCFQILEEITWFKFEHDICLYGRDPHTHIPYTHMDGWACTCLYCKR